MAGGTGLYINSLIYPLDFTDGITNWKYRDQLNEIANDKGNEYLHNLLKEIDLFLLLIFIQIIEKE